MEIKKEYLPYMKDIFRALPETLFIKDGTGKYVFTTKVCDLINAGSEGTIIGKYDYEIQQDPELGMRYHQEDLEILEKGISTHTIDSFELNGETFHMEIFKNPIFNDEKEIIGICGICNDITELIHLRQKYEQLSVIDPLTSLYNRNFTVKLDLERESALPCSYIFCDCNGLKQVNDQFGHDSGDFYLRETARILKEIAPPSSHVIRWGGDEFVIITPSCPEDMHQSLLQAIKDRQKCFSQHYAFAGLAVGGALRTDLRVSEAEILKLADAQMYADKKEGHAHLSSFPVC